jgi:hypothetical protein
MRREREREREREGLKKIKKKMRKDQFLRSSAEGIFHVLTGFFWVSLTLTELKLWGNLNLSFPSNY